MRRVHFKRSRGFALEAVDGADLSNIIFEDSTLEDISSSPIFIRVGDRGRFPVTGNSVEEDIIPSKDLALNVRLDNTNWVLPSKKVYQSYPAKRYLPSYNRTRKVSVDGHSYFRIVDSEEPCRLNPANYYEENNRFFALKYDDSSMSYVPNYEKELKQREFLLYANASGSDNVAYIHDIVIRNISVKNVDPRYPIELIGLDGSRIRNVFIENIKVQYRGELSLENAVEQRQLNTNWEYAQNGKDQRSIQSLPWFVNTFFLKNEGLLPRVEWDQESICWKDNPFNVPEFPEVYPEPSNWGILPAYGLYARHVENLYLHNIEIGYTLEDGRYPIVFDDVVNSEIKCIKAAHAKNVEEIVYVPNYSYHMTSVDGMEADKDLSIKYVEINSPAPGTPKDGLYPYETVAIPETGYTFSYTTKGYPLPQTVFRPFFIPVPDQFIKASETLVFDVIARQPAFETSRRETDGKIYNESIAVKEFTIQSVIQPMILKTVKLPKGANFDSSLFAPGKACVFTWTPTADDICMEPYTVTFIVDDGIIPVKMEVKIKGI